MLRVMQVVKSDNVAQGLVGIRSEAQLNTRLLLVAELPQENARRETCVVDLAVPIGRNEGHCSHRGSPVYLALHSREAVIFVRQVLERHEIGSVQKILLPGDVGHNLRAEESEPVARTERGRGVEGACDARDGSATRQPSLFVVIRE
jgi:hypothetical protein